MRQEERAVNQEARGHLDRATVRVVAVEHITQAPKLEPLEVRASSL
jgi:hypothetical protein